MTVGIEKCFESDCIFLSFLARKQNNNFPDLTGTGWAGGWPYKLLWTGRRMALVGEDLKGAGGVQKGSVR